MSRNNMFKSSNPSLKEDVFSKEMGNVQSGQIMTLDGAVNKTGILCSILLLSAIYTYDQGMNGTINPVMIGGGFIVGFILAIIISFKAHLAPTLAPVYAVAEGLALGGISAFFETKLPGIVSSAIFLTMGTLFTLLFAYKSGLIKVTEKFKLGVAAATGGIFVLYLLNMILGFFGSSIPFIHEGGTFGILFSLGVVVVAALNLVLDFDFIKTGAEMGAPKYMEWYGAFGLLVTLVWLYLEILRLLYKLQSRD